MKETFLKRDFAVAARVEAADTGAPWPAPVDAAQWGIQIPWRAFSLPVQTSPGTWNRMIIGPQDSMSIRGSLSEYVYVCQTSRAVI